MKSKRIKISFIAVNAGKYAVISQRDICESNKRINQEMKVVVREYERNNFLSRAEAAKLVINV
jgi:hypothetical protein